MDEISQNHFDKVVAKDLNDLTPHDVAFLQARRSYLNKEQKETYAKLLKSEVKAEPAPEDKTRLSTVDLKKKAQKLGLAHKGLSREQLEQDLATVEGPAGTAAAGDRAFSE